MRHELARAKVNLTLEIQGRRPDGYHQLQSLVVFGDAAGDRLTFEPDAPCGATRVRGPFAQELRGKDNLVDHARKAFATAMAIPESGRFTLEKHLPVAAGIGGGSADAAGVLRLLSAHWQIELRSRQDHAIRLLKIAREIGADVPVCLASTPAVMCGTGDVLHPVSRLPLLHAVLVNPGTHVSTAVVFAALGKHVRRLREQDVSTLSRAKPDLPPSGDGLTPLIAWLDERPNQLEPAALAVRPEITLVRDALEATAGCKLVRMSGSGATWFALFGNEDAAIAARDRITREHPRWWCVATRLG